MEAESFYPELITYTVRVTHCYCQRSHTITHTNNDSVSFKLPSKIKFLGFIYLLAVTEPRIVRGTYLILILDPSGENSS